MKAHFNRRTLACVVTPMVHKARRKIQRVDDSLNQYVTCGDRTITADQVVTAYLFKAFGECEQVL